MTDAELRWIDALLEDLRTGTLTWEAALRPSRNASS
jgi:hypothetical protein